MKSPRLEALRAALEKAEFRLAATQDLARVGDWELDRHTGRMHWSRELFRLFERPEALGVPDLNEALGYFSLDSTNRTRDLFWEAIDTGRRCAGLLLRTLRGQIRPLTVMHKVPMVVPAV